MSVTPSKVRIISPATVTGGPELLHQLCDTLRRSGFDAAMCYTPFDQRQEKPEPYAHYDAPQAEFLDDASCLYVIPESRTGLLARIENAKSVIWWLSVDNYSERKLLREYPKSDRLDASRIWRFRLALDELRGKGLPHLCQSQYAADLLARAGIPSLPLGDYLNPDFFNQDPHDKASRRNLIAYNPKKGVRYVRRLMAAHPDLNWIALEGMTRDQMIAKLRETKLYVDFGKHPGRDRIPREAAICGCCIITGRDGAAGNALDVGIPTRYKVDTRSSDFAATFRLLTDSIFGGFESHSRRLDHYRDAIRLEREQFEFHASAIFGHLISEPSET